MPDFNRPVLQLRTVPQRKLEFLDKHPGFSPMAFDKSRRPKQEPKASAIEVLRGPVFSESPQGSHERPSFFRGSRQRIDEFLMS